MVWSNPCRSGGHRLGKDAHVGRAANPLRPRSNANPSHAVAASPDVSVPNEWEPSGLTGTRRDPPGVEINTLTTGRSCHWSKSARRLPRGSVRDTTKADDDPEKIPPVNAWQSAVSSESTLRGF